MFGGLADLVEPLRDGLVRRSVRQAIGRAVADPGRAGDAGAVSRLTQQTEMARDSFAGLVLVARSFVFTALGGRCWGWPRWIPSCWSSYCPRCSWVRPGSWPRCARWRACSGRRSTPTRRCPGAPANWRRGCATSSPAAAGASAGAPVERLIAEQERLTGRLARWSALRTLALGVAGRLPVVALLAGTPWLLGRGVSAGAVAGALTYLVQSLLPALDALMTAVGAAGTRLLVVLDRFCAPQPDSAAATTAPAVAPGVGAGPGVAVELRGCGSPTAPARSR
ncbi:hypothetical protein GCM10020254_14570 [Streptomyces goshikiensis]